MGISGLLPLLKEIQVQRNISEFKGQTFVDYAMFRVRLLKYHGVTPIVVFDGGPLPAKKRTEVDRARYVGEIIITRINGLFQELHG
ncbi:hypothetical protein QFC24_004894 [Naganishia onofrii]|uniref:Uncharacterized protein n=1 Tax=Naganishia onofrii TaxID=1851511 RepID=A0ACC2XCT1_9TREE|nr:hypothetical protein QFC24_004894 [Naganishia onofrii]